MHTDSNVEITVAPSHKPHNALHSSSIETHNKIYMTSTQPTRDIGKKSSNFILLFLAAYFIHITKKGKCTHQVAKFDTTH